MGRDQIQHLQRKFIGPDDYQNVRNKGIYSNVGFQDSILEENIFDRAIHYIRKIREVEEREGIISSYWDMPFWDMF